MSLEKLNNFLKEVELSIDATMIEKARHVAVQAHVDQTRWNGDAYITHPARVVEALRDRMVVNEQVVGYLHDVVEDTNVTLVQLLDFGFTAEQIAAIDSVTKRDGENYLDFVLRARANPIGRAVKMADINDNLRDLLSTQHKTMREKYQLALWILEH